MKHTITLFMLLAIAIVGCSQDVGTMAPDFTLKNTHNENFTLSDHPGNVTVVFFLGYACPSCKAIAPDVQSKLVEAYGNNENFLIVGIDTWNGTTAQVQSFINITNVSFNVLQQGSAVASSWGTSYDKLVILDTEGKIAFKGSGLVSSHLDDAVDKVKSLLSTATSIIDINNTNGEILSIYPNPARQVANVRVDVNEASVGKLTIYNAVGKLMYSYDVHLDQGLNQIALPIQGLNSGIHLLQLVTGATINTSRFTVK